MQNDMLVNMKQLAGMPVGGPNGAVFGQPFAMVGGGMQGQGLGRYVPTETRPSFIQSKDMAGNIQRGNLGSETGNKNGNFVFVS